MLALAIDIGGTHVALAVVSDRTILAKETLPSTRASLLSEWLPVFSERCRALMASAGVSAADCRGIAIAFCGLVDIGTRRMITTNDKYPDAGRVDLVAWAAEAFALPIAVENDARMALLGEREAGAARGFDDIVMMTFGTGVGGASMIGGHLLRGKHFQAGCLGGHMPITLGGRKCSCGNTGCVEAEASTWALPELIRGWEGFAQSALACENQLDFRTLIGCAQHDPVARQVLDRCLLVWAAGAVALTHAYDPEIIVLGGGIMSSSGAVLPFIEEYVLSHAWTPWGKPLVRAAELGNDAALAGALPLLREVLD